MVQWLRRSFITGFFVTIPLIISVVALVWGFRFLDQISAPLVQRLIGRELPGVGLVTTVLLVLVAGAVANNVVGKRALQRTEALLLHIPVFKTVYGPVKQLVAAFSPDNEAGFTRVVLVDQPGRGFVLGFLTREFTLVGQDGRPEALAAVYVPTNHLYLGDVLVFPRERVRFPDLSVEEGVRIFLTGGTSVPARVPARGTDGGPGPTG
jgi:uncharacterized membrane protein